VASFSPVVLASGWTVVDSSDYRLLTRVRKAIHLLEFRVEGRDELAREFFR
jgi:hypothetical protein